MAKRATQEIRKGFPDSAAAYLDYLTSELEESFGAVAFRIQRAAPPDITREQLEVIAADLRSIGWNAEVVPFEEEGETAIGIRLTSDRPPVGEN